MGSIKLISVLLCAVLLACTPASKYKVGDIVCFTLNNKPVVINWVYGGYSPQLYSVRVVNDFNQIYSVDVSEKHLKECEEQK